ncbi:MAG: hypothetical protein BRD38_00310 [Bacteroidetes bacterium QH_9_67_14]|nr:MAG: hypothetical protein BRD38_00310 [Bacteroidetes bacterium QH_9_67_14]
MPSSSAYAAVATLRTAFRRLWYSAAIGAVAVLALGPLIYVLPAPAWQRVALGGGGLLYLAAKGYRLHATWRAVRQLRLEGCFIGHSFDGYQLRRCLQRRGHLWTHSYTVRALRRLMARPLPNLLMTGRKHQRVRTEYERTLRRLRPSPIGLDLPLGLMLTGTLLASATGAADTLPTWPLRAGLTSALVLLGAETGQSVIRYRARRFFDQLVGGLADWTLARSVHDLLRGRQRSTAYQHTPLYRAPAWFAHQAPGRAPAAGEDNAPPAPAPSSTPSRTA